MADIAPETLSRAQAGDRQAFDELVRFYRDDLLRVAYRFVGNYEDAHDVLQHVFVKVWQNVDRWEPRAPFWSWLYRIAVNESLGWKKREKRRYEIVSPLEDTAYPDAESGAPSPLDDVALRQLERRIRRAVEKLPEMQRATFVLRFREELSVKETAAVLGCAEGTVKANGYHAIRRLRKILDADLEAGEAERRESTAL
ncbi:MAG TPA: sigma-70 family RNA polymerase sigma factor [Gemmatimonadota bacterium]|nr:sigma-70 family RNA polymerase sigma factor [Gemmatimonadota bacterium]